MRASLKTFLALAAFGLLAAPALAQRPGGGGGGRQGGGFGGFGGFGAPQAGPTLLLNKSVQDELKLTDDVKAKLTKISEKQREEMGKLFGQGGQGGRRGRGAGGQGGAGGRGGADREKMQEAMTKITEETNKAISEVEKDLKPEQIKRFKQIKVQVAGVRAFNDPEVQKELNLTDKQKADVKGTLEDLQKDTRELMQGARGNREQMAEMRKKIEAVNKEALEKLTNSLSADQKKTLTELTGPKFELKVDAPRGRNRPNPNP
jgi:Spy/CpxP family protein refolding chaperone